MALTGNPRPSIRRAISGGFLTWLVMLASLALGSAQPTTAQSERLIESIGRGALTYQVYCRSCHGEEAHGDGPIASVLRTPPPDLTLISHRADGEFPALDVRRTIDGRVPIASHGPSEMPVWGLTFAVRGEDDPYQVMQRIDDLVEYLRSLQRDPGQDEPSPAPEPSGEHPEPKTSPIDRSRLR